MDRLARGQLLNRAIQDQIKQYITTNRLRPGDLLPPEGQLAVDLGVSRGSVREAIKALESLGIVDVRHGDGVRVRAFNFDSVFDLLSFGIVFDPVKVVEILQVRIWLEEAAVGDAILCITEGALAEMDTVLARWTEKAAKNADTSEEDRSFHQLLYSGLNNESLSRLIDIFWLIYHAMPLEDIPDWQPLGTVEAHRELLVAVRGRDVQLTRQRMRDHFRNLERRIAHVTNVALAGIHSAEARVEHGATA